MAAGDAPPAKPARQWRRRLFLAASAGVGSDFFFLVDQGFLLLQHSADHWGEFLLMVALLFTVSALFLERFLASLRGLFHRAGELTEPPLPQMLALGLAAIVLEQAFHEAASSSPSDAIRNVATAMFLVGGVTLSWTLTDQQLYRGAWLYGFIVGLLAGAIAVAVPWLIHGGALFEHGRLTPRTFLSMLDAAVGNGLFFWGPIGAAGGLALRCSNDRFRRFALPASILATGLALDLATHANWRASVAANLGWAIVLFLRGDLLTKPPRPRSEKSATKPT
jgi:hypothetical protein